MEEKEPWKPGFPPAATSTWIEGQSFYIYMCRRSNLRFLRSDLQSLSRPGPIVLHSIRAILPKNPLCLYTWDGNCDCIQQEQEKKQNSNFPVSVLRTSKWHIWTTHIQKHAPAVLHQVLVQVLTCQQKRQQHQHQSHQLRQSAGRGRGE